MVTNTDVGKAIKVTRIEKDIQGKELGVLSQLSGAFISQVEKGKRVPSFDKFLKLCIALDVNPSYIMLKAEGYAEQRKENASPLVDSNS